MIRLLVERFRLQVYFARPALTNLQPSTFNL